MRHSRTLMLRYTSISSMLLSPPWRAEVRSHLRRRDHTMTTRVTVFALRKRLSSEQNIEVSDSVGHSYILSY